MGLRLHVTTIGDLTEVALGGVIDEHADFNPLEGIRGAVRFDLREVRRINSYGCRKWMDAVRALSQHAKVIFVACAPAVVDQLNTTYGFLGSGSVESFVGVMRCERCDKTFDHLFDAQQVLELDKLPPVRCPSCGDPAELDDIEDTYLSFLREPTQVGLPSNR